MTSPGYSMYHHGPPSPVFDGADSFPGFRRVKPLPKSKRRRMAPAPYNTGYPPAGITPGTGGDGQGEEGATQHHWAYRNPAVAGSHTAAAPGTIPTDPGGPGHGGGGVFPPFFLPHLPPPATREEEQRQQELLHRATTGFLASLEGLQLPGPEATAEELLAHAETLSARMQSYYAAHSQIPPMPPAGFPLQTQASHQLPPPMPMPMPTGFPLMNARPPPHLLSSILGPPPPLPSGASVGGGAQTGLELPPLGPAVANAGDGEEVTLPPPTNIPLPSPSSLYAQAHNIGLGLGYSLGMAGMTTSGNGGGSTVPTSSAATDYLHWAYQRQQAVAASTASAPSAAATEPDRDYYDRYRDADRDSDYGQRNGPNNNKKRKVPANAHGRLLGGRGTAEGDLLDLDFATVDSGNGNGHGGGGAGIPGSLGGLEAEIDELAAGMLGALGGIGGDGGDKGRGGSGGRGQYTRRLEDDDEDPDGRGTYDRPVTPSGAGSGDPRPPQQQHSSLSLLLAAKKKSKLTAATLAALQRKELVASRRRQLAAALGPPPNAPDLSQPPPMPAHPSKRNPNAPPPPQPVPKSDAGLAMEQALLTACLRPLVNSSLVNAGGNKGTPGGGKKQLPAPVNEKGEKMRLSKRTCVRLGRVAKKVPRHPDQMPFPVLKAFGFRWESAAGERAVATQEEATAWRNRFEAELARQSNKAATKGGASTKSHNASNSISSAKGASPRKGPKSKKAQRAAANAARNVSGGVGAGEEAKFIDPISGETTNVMPGTLPPPASIGSGPTTSGKGGAQPTPTPAPIAGTNSTNSSQATPPPQGGKQSPVPATTSKKKKKRSALANASNPHHLRNYVPSRLPASAGGGGNGGPGDILGWPIPVRFLSAEIAPKKKGKRHSAPANNTDGSGLPLTNPADEWICAYCEYALFYGGSKGSGGSYKKAVKNRKKILKRRRRARERAALAASGKGGVKEVEKGQEGNEDDWDGAKGYEEGPDKSVPATVGGGNVKGRGAGAGGGGKGDQGGYG